MIVSELLSSTYPSVESFPIPIEIQKNFSNLQKIVTTKLNFSWVSHNSPQPNKWLLRKGIRIRKFAWNQAAVHLILARVQSALQLVAIQAVDWQKKNIALIQKLFLQKITEVPKNLQVGPFLNPISHITFWRFS